MKLFTNTKKISLIALLTVVFIAAQSALAVTNYVWTNSPSDGPGTAWSNAFHTIQGGVDAAADSDTVWVTNGIYDNGLTITPGYALTNRVCITNAITVRSVNGPTNTFIKGASDSGSLGSNAVRCVYMINGSMLIGFTITNGYTMDTGDLTFDQSGGGVWADSANCVISNCTFSGNSVGRIGGGAYRGTLNNCTLSGNSADDGGGAYDCTLNNCTLSRNSAVTTSGGGGANACTLNNCTLTGNSSSGHGGGAVGGTLNNCTISGNSAGASGGGAFNATLYNCLLTGNSAGNWAGGAYNCTLNNCTISENSCSSGHDGGGTHSGTLTDCIVYYNTNTVGAVDNITNAVSVTYTCSTNFIGGAGCITNPPLFIDRANSNFHLRLSSPCVNTGTNQNWMTNAVDLDGNNRIIDGIVDMGAYETVIPPKGTTFMVM